MKSSTLFASIIFTTFTRLYCHAMPTNWKRTDVTDGDILNVALTLEHLENAFYNGYLSEFTSANFKDDGLPEFAYGRFMQIRDHERTHVEFLTSALHTANIPAVQPCTYTFPAQTPHDFVATAAILETVGTSAYSGAAKLLADRNYVEAGAIILATEARHSSWIQSAVEKKNPWSGAFETILDLNQAYTLASSFISSCPDSNPKLPVAAFPPLSVPANAKPGQEVQLSFNPPTSGKQLYAVFMSGLDTKFIQIGPNMTVRIPEDLNGTVYALVTDDGSTASDDHTVAGPAIVMFPFNSHGVRM